MIITCPCEKKQFKIDSSLIPQEGRELQCGSCERVWFYKPKNESKAPLTLNENASVDKVAPDIEIKSRRIGNTIYQVPIPLDIERKLIYSIRFLIEASRSATPRFSAADSVIARKPSECGKPYATATPA